MIQIETTSICLETTCIETTLYRNDRKPCRLISVRGDHGNEKKKKTISQLWKISLPSGDIQ